MGPGIAESRSPDDEAMLPDGEALRAASGGDGPHVPDNEQLDLDIVVRVAEALTGELVRETLIQRVIELALQTAGADRGMLVLGEQELSLRVAAEASMIGNKVYVRVAERALEELAEPLTILRSVARTHRRSFVQDVAQLGDASDRYLRLGRAGSLLCIPLCARDRCLGVLYLESRGASRDFAPARLTVLSLLVSQAATSFENARLLDELRAEIAERRRTEAELRRSEAFLAEGQRVSRCGTWAHNLATDEMSWSRETYTVWDLDPAISPNIGSMRERVHPDDRELFGRMLRTAREERTPNEVGFRIIAADGSVRHLWAVGQLAGRDEMGSDIYSGATMDITPRKLGEAALSKAQSDLAHAGRVAMLGELTASIAHEVLQPLAGIVTNGEAGIRWLDRAEPNIAKAKASFDAIVSDAHRAGEVVHRLRAMSRKQPPAMELLTIDAIVADAVGLVGREVERHGITLDLAIDAGLPPVRVDRIQMQQVLVNFLMNATQAIEAVPCGPANIVVRAYAGSLKSVRLEVRDTGSGVPDGETGRLFDTFYTTKPDGLGLGLTICRSIVEAHGGKVDVAPNGERGTVFGFELPAGESG